LLTVARGARGLLDLILQVAQLLFGSVLVLSGVIELAAVEEVTRGFHPILSARGLVGGSASAVGGVAVLVIACQRLQLLGKRSRVVGETVLLLA
jgi:hypothetical protein